MDETEFPLISVVTPVYNGAKYIAECIESVAKQSYPNIEHVIVDNASTDATRDIVTRYATNDPRIRLVEFPDNVPVIENWNRSIGFIDDAARFVWVLPADDALVGESLLKMGALARDNPSVGIVASLRYRGNRIQCGGLPTSQTVFSGRDIVRSFMREEVFAFSPTSSLIRRDLLERDKPFYPAKYLHADIAAFFDVLDRVDFGFVHEILMFSREHAESVTATQADLKGSQFRDGLLMLQEFGPRYFAPAELASIERGFLRRYYRYLVRSAVLMREKPFFAFHAEALREAKRFPSAWAMAQAALVEMERALLKPMRTLGYIRSRIEWEDDREYLWRDPRPN